MSVAIENLNLSSNAPFRGSLLLRAHAPEITPRHHLALIPTNWGTCGLVWQSADEPSSPNRCFAAKPTHTTLCRIITPGLTVSELRKQLLAHYPLCNEVLGDGHGNFHPEVVPDWLPDLVQYLQAYYATSLRGIANPPILEHFTFWKPRLHWSQLTDFQRRVLAIVAEIPRGTCLTYGQVARRIGKPNASRAVGAAIGSNPWPVLIPCHRVVGSSGALTGFSAPGGITTKKRMLDMEKANTLF